MHDGRISLLPPVHCTPLHRASAVRPHCPNTQPHHKVPLHCPCALPFYSALLHCHSTQPPMHCLVPLWKGAQKERNWPLREGSDLRWDNATNHRSIGVLCLHVAQPCCGAPLCLCTFTCRGSVCPAHALHTTFSMTFPRSAPKFTITQRSLGLGNVMTVLLWSDRERGFHQQGGPKELSEGRQLRELMGMVGDSRDTKGDGVHGASIIDSLHTTWIILQHHMPIVQKVNHLRGHPKPRKKKLNSITNSKRGLRT